MKIYEALHGYATRAGAQVRLRVELGRLQSISGHQRFEMNGTGRRSAQSAALLALRLCEFSDRESLNGAVHQQSLQITNLRPPVKFSLQGLHGRTLHSNPVP